jgi:hypothetical protein
MSNTQDVPNASRPLWHWALPASALVVISISLTWAVQELPSICPAVYPAPASCAADARLLPAIVGSAVLVGLFILLLATGRLPRVAGRDGLLWTVLLLIGLAAVVAPMWTLNASGFIVG